MKKFNIKKILPGLILCTLIAYLSIFLGQYLPSLGAASLSIFIGILFRNLIFKETDLFSAGSNFAESYVLPYAIVLLGGTLSMSTIIKIGFSGVGFIVLQMTITILSAIFIGKKLGFSKNFGLLMASGNAVCGSAAIAATAPVVCANEQEKGISITIVNVTGTVLMLLLPFLAGIIYNHDTLQTSAFIGGILQSVGQVVASGSMVNESVKDLATIFKIVRVMFLVFVVLAFSMLDNKSTEDRVNELGKEKSKKVEKKTKIQIPWYVIGFFIMCGLFSFGLISDSFSLIIKSISSKFEIIALAGIGMRVNIKTLIAQGVKASIYALLIAIVQIVTALTLVRFII